MNKRCIFCSILCADYCCSQCNQMNRGYKFTRLLQVLDKCSDSMMYYDEISLIVQRVRQVSSLEF